MSLTRRKVAGVLVVAAITALAGCGAAGPMTVKDTRLAHDGDKIGVYVELQDTNPNRAPGRQSVHRDNETMTYQFTTIDYSHPDPKYRTTNRVSVHLQTDFGEVVAGASIQTTPNEY